MFLYVLCIFLGSLQISLCAKEQEKNSFETIVSNGMNLIPEIYRDWIANQEISYSQLKTQHRNYKDILEKVCAISKYLKKDTTVGSLEKNRWRNLHPLVLPYDETRTLRDKKDFYISANDVFTPEQFYIVAQAPTEQTLSAFWTTILETNTHCVAALAMPRGEHKTFSDYWTKDRFPMKVDGWNLSFIKKDVVATSSIDPHQRIVQRIFCAEKQGASHYINHIHYENWPDLKAPAEDLFQELLQLLSDQNSSPILVHCSAGMGRAGTLVTTDSLLREAKKLSVSSSLRVNIPKRIVDLRMQRKGIVSTRVQLEAVYHAVAAGIARQGLISVARESNGLFARPSS